MTEFLATMLQHNIFNAFLNDKYELYLILEIEFTHFFLFVVKYLDVTGAR